MYRIVKSGNKWYGLKISSIEEDMENIQEFVDSGNVVCIGDDIEWIAEELEIDEEDIVIVE